MPQLASESDLASEVGEPDKPVTGRRMSGSASAVECLGGVGAEKRSNLPSLGDGRLSMGHLSVFFYCY